MGSRSNRRNMPGDKYNYNFEKPNAVNYSKFSPPPIFQNYEEQLNYSGRPQDYNDLPISQNYERSGINTQISNNSQYQPYEEPRKSERRRSRSPQQQNVRRSPHQNRGRNKRSRSRGRKSRSIELRKRSPIYKDHHYNNSSNRNHLDQVHNNQPIRKQDGRNFDLLTTLPVPITDNDCLDDFPPNNSGYLPMSNIPSLLNLHGSPTLGNSFYCVPNTFPPEENLTIENPFSGMSYQNNSHNREVANMSPLLPEFNPETSKLTSEEWMDLVEEVAIKQNWTHDEKQYMMTSRLTGLASKWYLTSGVGTKSWNGLKSMFLGAFPTELEYFELLKRMMDRMKTKDESISNYFHHKMALLNACEIFGRKAVSCLIYGISIARIKREAKRMNFNDPDSLYAYLRTCDFSTGPCGNQEVKTRAKEDKPRDKELKPHDKQERGRFQEAARSSRRKEEPREEIPSLFKQQSSEFFTEAHIKDVRFRAYIDETSPTTTIREEDCIDTKLPIKRQSQTIQGHGGSMVSSVGYVETSLVVDKAKANVKIYVVPTNTQPFPIVVGGSFIEQRHIYILNKEKRMRIYQKMDDGFINFDF